MTTITRSSATPGFVPAGHDGPAWAPPRPSAPKPERPTPTRASAERELTRARRLWSLLPVAGLVATAGSGFHRVFDTGALLPVTLVAVVVPVLLSLALSGLLSRKGRTTPLWPSLLLTLVLWLVTVTATLFREDGGPLPTGDAVRTVWAALLDSPHAILTTILPVPGEPELLVLPHAVVWLAAFTSAELALRTRTALLPAVPAVIAFGFPVVLGVDGPGSNIPYATALVAFAALLVLLRSRAAASGVRGLAVALPFVGVLAVAAGLLGPQAPGLSSREPYDLRQEVDPPVQHPESASPLDQIGAWMQYPDTKLFKVRATGPGAPDGGDDSVNWRLAVLDRFNGAKWTSGAELARSGGRVPRERGADPGSRERLEQRFTVQELPGIWLPVADRPSEVEAPEGTEVSVDPSSGVIATSADGSTGAKANAGLEYTAVSRLPRYDVKRLQYAATTDNQADKKIPLTDESGQPIAAVKTFQDAATKATEGSSYPYQQAVKLADWLRENYKFDPNAVPGHTYRNLEYFLTSGKRGTSEQFAASFAVLARTLGLPARVAVGFRTGTETGSDTRQVTGADALAWPEVEFKGIGWVPFYPTPGEATEEGTSVAPAGQPKERKKVDEEVAEQPRTSDPAKPEKDEQAGGAAQDGGLPVWVYPPLAVLLLATAYCLYALWLPYRRRSRRRRAADSGLRVLGAWEQIVERLTEIGLPPTSAHTATEVASFGSKKVGGAAGEHLPALAKLVNEVGYAGRKPDTTSANAAWLHCDAIEKVVVRSVNRRARLRRTLHPRSLRHR